MHSVLNNKCSLLCHIVPLFTPPPPRTHTPAVLSTPFPSFRPSLSLYQVHEMFVDQRTLLDPIPLPLPLLKLLQQHLHPHTPQQQQQQHMQQDQPVSSTSASATPLLGAAPEGAAAAAVKEEGAAQAGGVHSISKEQTTAVGPGPGSDGGSSANTTIGIGSDGIGAGSGSSGGSNNSNDGSNNGGSSGSNGGSTGSTGGSDGNISWRHVYLGSSAGSICSGMTGPQLRHFFSESALCIRSYSPALGSVALRLPQYLAPQPPG